MVELSYHTKPIKGDAPGVVTILPYGKEPRERHNRIFRRYIPKGVSIDLYSAEQILHFADEMNALPRKQLGYRTPEELFEKFLDKVYSLKNIQVA